jgi:serine/threonine protein kinase
MSLPPSTPVDLRIGAYQPCFEIGSGGMASVYIAKELGASGLQRTVALKVMHEHLSKQEHFRQRFLDEARVLTHIAHPYVCRVVGFGEEGRRPFMAMEYLVGEPLSRVLRAMKRKEDVLPAARRARLFARAIADLAEGLHAAHETRDLQGSSMGVVHRDVTPQNLFVLYDGTVRVLDFGIARYHDRQVHTATTGHLLGKLPYMAPEQVMSEPYDRRVDVWALGVVLWELVTLGRLFKRETEMRTMRAVCSDPIPLVSELVQGVPRGLDEILDRALARNPDDRFKTAREFSRSLELWLSRSGDPVTHADLSEFLNGFFPGSEDERRRWAEESSPNSEFRRMRDETDDDVVTKSIQDGERAPIALPSEDPTLREGRSSHALPRMRTKTARDTDAVTQRLRPYASAASGEIPIEQSAVLVASETAPRSRPTSRWAGVFAASVAVGAIALAVSSLFLIRQAPLESPRLWSAAAGKAAVSLAGNAGLEDRVRVPLFFPEQLALLAAPTDPVKPAEAVAVVHRAPAAPAGPVEPSEPEPSAELATGDLLVVSGKPGVSVRVYLGERFLGTTPVRARVPAGTVALSVQVHEGAPRMPISAKVGAGRVNMITVGLGD